jgi:hypothetical protein
LASPIGLRPTQTERRYVCVIHFPHTKGTWVNSLAE